MNKTLLATLLIALFGLSGCFVMAGGGDAPRAAHHSEKHSHHD